LLSRALSFEREAAGLTDFIFKPGIK
jgi:hypothetical protein